MATIEFAVQKGGRVARYFVFLTHECVSQPANTLARAGCSRGANLATFTNLRHSTAGPFPREAVCTLEIRSVIVRLACRSYQLT